MIFTLHPRHSGTGAHSLQASLFLGALLLGALLPGDALRVRLPLFLVAVAGVDLVDQGVGALLVVLVGFILDVSHDFLRVFVVQQYA